MRGATSLGLGGGDRWPCPASTPPTKGVEACLPTVYRRDWQGNSPCTQPYSTIPSGVIVFHCARVKSGISIDSPRFAADSSLSGPITDQVAAS